MYILESDSCCKGERDMLVGTDSVMTECFYSRKQDELTLKTIN